MEGDIGSQNPTSIRFSHDIKRELRTVMARFACGDHVQRSTFRTAELEHYAGEVFPDSVHTDYSDLLEHKFNAFLIARRALNVDRLPSMRAVDDECARPGSLLAVDWMRSLFDGAVEPETDGFLNNDYLPGWDSWLALAEIPTSGGTKCLISWVPTTLSDKVDFGIVIDPASCMSWLTINGNGEAHLVGWGTSVFGRGSGPG